MPFTRRESPGFSSRRLRSFTDFTVCREMLLMFYQAVMVSILFYSVVCWGYNIARKEAARLKKLVK